VILRDLIYVVRGNTQPQRNAVAGIQAADRELRFPPVDLLENHFSSSAVIFTGAPTFFAGGSVRIEHGSFGFRGRPRLRFCFGTDVGAPVG
jgi:hypothetical protein